MTRDETIKLSNSEMETMLMALDRSLDHKGVIGYAIARNYRTLADCCQDFLAMKQRVVNRYGSTKDDPNKVFVSFEDPEAKQAVDELTECAAITHDVTVCKVPMQDAAELCTAREIISLAWMLYEGDNQCKSTT